MAMTLFAALGITLAAACASGAPLPGGTTGSLAQPEPETVIEGELEVLVEDAAAGSRTVYHLITAKQRIELRFAGTGPALITGTPVRVRGRWDADGALVVSSLEKR